MAFFGESPLTSPGFLRTGMPSDSTLTTSNVDQLAALSGLLAGTQATQISATGQANAANETATGAAAEASAYGSAGAVAQENEDIAGIAGQISILQQQRQVAQTAGQAQAAAGAGGALASGSVMDVLNSTYTQGALGAQTISVQTALDQGGYAEEYQATQAEVAAANAQAAAAKQEADAFTSEASLAAQQTQQLQALYPSQTTSLNNIQNNPAGLGVGAPPPGFDPGTGLSAGSGVFATRNSINFNSNGLM